MAHTITTIEVEFSVKMSMEVVLEDPDPSGAVNLTGETPMFQIVDPVELVEGGEEVGNVDIISREKMMESLAQAASTGHSWKLNGQEDANYGGRFAELPPFLRRD